MKLSNYSWHIGLENLAVVEFAKRDLQYNNSQGCTGGLLERIFGQRGEVGYKELRGYPIVYHPPFAVDVEQENAQLKTVSFSWWDLYIREEAFGHPEWRHILIAPMVGHDCKPPFSEVNLPEFFEIKGWATLDMFLKYGKEKDWDNGRYEYPVWSLKQNQLNKREDYTF